MNWTNSHTHTNELDLPQCLDQNQIGEIVQLDERLQHLLIEVVLLAQIIACRAREKLQLMKLPASVRTRPKARTNCRFVQALAFVQEMCNVLGVHLQQVILAQVLDACVVNLVWFVF